MHPQDSKERTKPDGEAQTPGLPGELSSAIRVRAQRLLDQGLKAFAWTANLSRKMQNLKIELSPERSALHLNAIYSLLLDHIENFQSISPGPVRTRYAHELVDAAIEKAGANESCRKGCAFCCHTSVFLTENEMDLILASVPVGRISSQQSRLQAQRSVDPQAYGRLLPWADSACVFLNPDKTCAVYADRPLSCRKLAVTSAPQLCDPRIDQQTQTLFRLEAEIIASAFYSIEAPGRIPDLLLAKPGLFPAS